MTSQIEVKRIQMVASNGKPIRKVTRVTIDGFVTTFTETLTKKQVAAYVASHQARREAKRRMELARTYLQDGAPISALLTLEGELGRA